MIKVCTTNLYTLLFSAAKSVVAVGTFFWARIVAGCGGGDATAANGLVTCLSSSNECSASNSTGLLHGMERIIGGV